MAGKHEPGSSASFYLSLATATLRALLVVAAVVLGIFVLTRAFPTDGTGEPAAEAPPPAADPAASPSPSPVEPEEPEDTPQVEGVSVAVLNGTNATGAAAGAAQRIQRLGFDVSEENISNAQGTYERTQIFFARPAERDEAQFLADELFEGARVQRAPADGDAVEQVQITVVVGSDHADRFAEN